MIEKAEIKRELEKILSRKFPASEKQEIREFSERFNFSCPYCGDSDNTYKKRGNIYFDGYGSFHCFNCGKHRSLNGFFKDFRSGISLPEEKTFSRKTASISVLFNLFLSYGVEEDSFMRCFQTKRIEKGSQMYQYLKSRMVRQNNMKFFMESKFRKELCLLHIAKGKILGCQIRSFEENMPKYRSIKLSKILERCDKDRYNAYISDENGKKIFDSWSMCFKLTECSSEKKILVTEGFFDSLFLPNSVCTSGARNTPEILKENDNCIWIYDNDKTGKELSKKALKEGRTVFLWKKFCENTKLEHIKDVNDLVIELSKYEKEKQKKIVKEFHNSISTSPLDILFL